MNATIKYFKVESNEQSERLKLFQINEQTERMKYRKVSIPVFQPHHGKTVEKKLQE
ncbi:hypothetical protein GA0061087_10834 [Priestia flexa]|nr:hypothetical protein GA0061087_10834 [Priestia flexa]